MATVLQDSLDDTLAPAVTRRSDSGTVLGALNCSGMKLPSFPWVVVTSDTWPLPEQGDIGKGHWQTAKCRARTGLSLGGLQAHLPHPGQHNKPQPRRPGQVLRLHCPLLASAGKPCTPSARACVLYLIGLGMGHGTSYSIGWQAGS